MTEPHSEEDDSGTRQISVAELLARNGTVGSPAVARRRRRRRGDRDMVTVAELTGEIPIVHDDEDDDQPAQHDDRQAAENQTQPPPSPPASTQAEVAESAGPESKVKAAYWAEPEPRWPKSPPQSPRGSGPQRSEYPRPLRHTDDTGANPPGSPSGAEHMSPDPMEQYDDISVDVMDAEVSDVESTSEDSAYVRSYLQSAGDSSERDPDQTLFGGQSIADEVARRGGAKQAGAGLVDHPDFEGELAQETAEQEQEVRRSSGKIVVLWRGLLVVLQSILAVVFGAGLFIAFDELWRWNSILALALSVLVILGLVVGVRVVRKTEDIASTLIAVAVGALITWGPLVLSLQSG